MVSKKSLQGKHTSQRIFTIGRQLSRRSMLTISIVTFGLLLVLWWGVTTYGLVQPIFIPSPPSVWQRLVVLWDNGTLISDIQVSVYRILTAFIISSIMSIIIGVLAGCFAVGKAIIEPLVDFIRYMPVVAFVPLTILWFGTGDQQKFIIIWIGTFFQQVLMVIDATKRVPADFIGLGRTLGMSESKILFKIVIPSALPAIWDTLRISLGWAWTWLVVAELVAATSGLGYRILLSQRYFQTDTIIGYILILGLLGLITDQLMRLFEKILFRYNVRSK
ncbi:ABC transporter permease [Gilliamella sp. B3464]|uniref:ABC transporter permease n=1 Tax=unclassified Gilliamella TaxID=2685620 RepID=UPI00226A005C|nr:MULTISPECIES: ABC transporter permease [unclassified Gilliamella]MCX8712951.1 ABC transporter permease [Gilliamella sp. B3468]MCX8727500.1 ABC transporter permease [Gilliamella sp. B2838]MCX8752137.1 ABC transporter permease [Gilliamella sp. B3464]